MRVNEHLRLVLEIDDLAPVVRHASANLNVTGRLPGRLDKDHLFRLDKIGYISLVIDSTRVVAGSKSVPVASREEGDGQLLSANEHRLNLNDLTWSVREASMDTVKATYIPE